MPRWAISAPRKKLPPPTTIATCTPVRTTSQTWRAMSATTSRSRPTSPPPNTSPESFRSTRLYGPSGSSRMSEEAAPGVLLIGSGLLVGSGCSGRTLGLAHLEAREAEHRDAGLLEHLAHGL